MSDSTPEDEARVEDDGVLPFDPVEVGPFDLARAAVGDLRRSASENSRAVLVSVVVLVVASWYFGVSLPRPPNALIVVALSGLLAAPSAWVVGKKLASALYQPDDELLSVQDPANGDQRLVRLAPDRFADLSVRTHNDKQRKREFLHVVQVNGRRAYEVDEYDPESNVAVASWQAGVSNSEIRRDRASIKRIKTSLEREADKSLELLANHPNILREQAREVSNRLIKVAEGVEVPQGGELHSRLGQKLDEADPSEDLLDDGVDEPEDDSEDDLLDPTDDGEEMIGIFSRAVRNGTTEEAPADD